MKSVDFAHLFAPDQFELLFWLITGAGLLALLAWLPWILSLLHRQSNRASPPQIIPDPPQPRPKFHLSLRPIITSPLTLFLCLIALSWISYLTLQSHMIALLLFVLFSAAGFLTPLFSRSFRSRRTTTGMFLLLILHLLLPPDLLLNQLTQRIAPMLGLNPGVAITKFQSVHFSDPILQTTASRIEFSREETSYFRTDNFSLEISGFLDIDSPGEYHFYLTSDDGSDFEVDGKTVLSNPGYHAATEVSATLALESGLYSIRIPYYNGASDAILKLEWSPPHQPRSVVDSTHLFIDRPDIRLSKSYRLLVNQIIPSVMLLLAVVGILLIRPTLVSRFKGTSAHRIALSFNTTVTEGLRSFRHHYRLLAAGLLVGVLSVCILWTWFYLPGFAPVQHGLRAVIYESQDFDEIVQTFDGGHARMHSISHRYFKRSTFAAVFEGFLRIETLGVYRFSLQADDGSRLRIDNSTVINAWTMDSRRSSTQTRELQPGLHRVRIEMHSEGSPAFIKWSYAPPGSKWMRPVPVEMLYSDTPSPEQLIRDHRFNRIRSGLLITLIVILLALLTVIFRMKPSGLLLHWTFFIGFYPIVAFVLLQTGWMDPDYRFGLEWFLRLALPLKLAVLSGILILLMPPVIRGIGYSMSLISQNRSLRRLIFIPALLLGVTGQMLFTGPLPIQPFWGMVCFVLSGLCVLLSTSNQGFGNMISPPKQIERTDEIDPIPRAFRIAAFLALLFIAAFVRFYRLHEMPPGLWWDEAQTGIAARDILQGHIPSVYDMRINAGSMLSFLIAGWFHLFGSSIHALRAYYATIGVITTGVSFAFFRQFFPAHWSLFGMALIAISRWLFSINRVAMATIDETILLTFLVFISYLTALRTGKRYHYLICGILTGIGLHLHTGARVLPLIIGIDLVSRAVQAPRRIMSDLLKPASVLILAAIVAFGPMAWHIIHHPSDYFKRSKETLLSTEYPGYYALPTLAENTVNYLKMYPFSGDWHPRHNVNREPQFAPMVSILALFGLACSLRRIRNNMDRFFLLGFTLVSVQGILTVHNGTANLNRVAENIPIVHFWAVCGMVYVAGGIRDLLTSRPAKYTASILASLIVLHTFAHEYHLYFNVYANWRDVVGVFGFQPELTEPAEVIRDLLDRDPAITVFAEYTRSDSFRYVLPAHPRLFEITGGRLPDALPAPPLAILVLEQNHSLNREVRSRFPSAEISDFDYSLIPGFTLFHIFIIRS